MNPVSVADVKQLMGFAPTDLSMDTEIQAALDAAITLAAKSRPDRDYLAPDAAERLGLIRLTRKLVEAGADDSGGSVETFGGFPASLVDSDIQRLLGLGRYRPGIVA